MILFRLLLFLIIAASPWAYLHAFCDLSKATGILRELNAGKQVLIVATGDYQQCSDEDEACADWSDRLNSFAAEEKSQLVVFRIPASKWHKVILQSPNKVFAKSTLFLKKSAQSFFFEGPITEANVYQYVEKYWKKGSVEKALEPFAPKKTDMKICIP